MTEKIRGVFPRGRKLWIKLKQQNGEWKNVPTQYRIGQEQHAARLRKVSQDRINAEGEFETAEGSEPTVYAFGAKWLRWRKRDIRSWGDDESRLRHHVYPVIGGMRVSEVRAKHIKELIAIAKSNKKAPRTIRNINTIIKSLFHDAEVEGLIMPGTTPAIMGLRELGKKTDGKREWRATAIYTREELEMFLSEKLIPWDRRVSYGLLGLGALRVGEMAGLRWRHIDNKLEPLGRIVVATSYDYGNTKTEQERWMPLHPALAGMLAEWKLSGWSKMLGRKPGPDDLIVPCPAPTNRGPRKPLGAMRDDHYVYKRMRTDRDALGLRHRRVHDLRRTFITLCREDGADKEILHLCTHGAPTGHDVMEMYTTFGWAKLCAQVSTLKIKRRTA